ncbi:MAG: histidinol dehydrogenase [Desulfosarcina sp.]|nr:histidinol dehydrogenase [Desulfobacterales bacterium]
MKIYRHPSAAAERRLAGIARRSLSFRPKDTREVARIIADVRKNGDQALIEYTRRFDAPRLKRNQLEVSSEEIKQAARRVDRKFKRALNRAIRQIEDFHRQQFRKSWIDTARDGVLLGQLLRPVDSAGIYVPAGQGGLTPLVSSVLMGALPARIAGVSRLAMVTPPTRSGAVNPHLLAAAQAVGIDAVYRTGSAWAIAALAYGTESIAPVDVIVGPGNLYVTLAKKLVAGTVGIDMLAGPSEILIVADHSANPAYAAADMLSQAEHDPLASAILLTNSATVARATAKALEQQLTRLTRRDIAAASLRQFGAIIQVDDLDTAIELANRIAPEHLELLTASPMDLVGRIRNAGAVFLGAYTPEPVGDYIAGPNHVLPTAGTARFSSALSVDNFIKKTSLIRYTAKALRKEAADILCLAEIEGLDAHANAVRLRLSNK